jgi:hypothetical protein
VQNPLCVLQNGATLVTGPCGAVWCVVPPHPHGICCRSSVQLPPPLHTAPPMPPLPPPLHLPAPPAMAQHRDKRPTKPHTQRQRWL